MREDWLTKLIRHPAVGKSYGRDAIHRFGGGYNSTAALFQDAIELMRVLFDRGDPNARNGE